MQMIRAERHEQIHKHKWNDLNKPSGELSSAAFFAEDPITNKRCWPKHWNIEYRHKIESKSDIDRLVISGALFLAEYDLTGMDWALQEAKRIAKKINKLLTT